MPAEFNSIGQGGWPSVSKDTRGLFLVGNRRLASILKKAQNLSCKWASGGQRLAVILVS